MGAALSGVLFRIVLALAWPSIYAALLESIIAYVNSDFCLMVILAGGLQAASGVFLSVNMVVGLFSCHRGRQKGDTTCYVRVR